MLIYCTFCAADVDIVTLQNPFKYLARDSDVESMSDGWDDATAYGYNDVKGGRHERRLPFNVGLCAPCLLPAAPMLP